MIGWVDAKKPRERRFDRHLTPPPSAGAEHWKVLRRYAGPALRRPSSAVRACARCRYRNEPRSGKPSFSVRMRMLGRTQSSGIGSDREAGAHRGIDRVRIGARIGDAVFAACSLEARPAPYAAIRSRHARCAIGSVSSRCTLCFIEVTHTSCSRRTDLIGIDIAAEGDDREIDLAAADPLDEMLRVHTFDIDRHQRMGAREARQDFGKEAVGIVVGRAEAQGAGEFRPREGRHRLVIELHDAPCIFDEPFAVGGEAALRVRRGQRAAARAGLRAASSASRRPIGSCSPRRRRG